MMQCLQIAYPANNTGALNYVNTYPSARPYVLHRLHTTSNRCLFQPPIHDPDYIEIARSFGYTSPTQYAMEHEVLHALLPPLAWGRQSLVIYLEAHRRWSEINDDLRQQTWAEEHLVNRFQRYINTGERDDDYGVLEGTLGPRLAATAGMLTRTLRPWLG